MEMAVVVVRLIFHQKNSKSLGFTNIYLHMKHKILTMASKPKILIKIPPSKGQYVNKLNYKRVNSSPTM